MCQVRGNLPCRWEDHTNLERVDLTRIADVTQQLQQFAREAHFDQPITIGLREKGALVW